MSKKGNNMRKTKIICTIGPACDSVKQIKRLMLAGMNVARLNFSHGNFETRKQTIENIKTARAQLGMPLAIMVDTKGPEIRIKKFENGFVNLKKNQLFTFTTNQILGNQTIVEIAYKNLVNQIKIGDTIFANNGMVVFKVVSVNNSDIVCKVKVGGKLTNGKGLNVPNICITGNYLSQEDTDDINFAMQNDVDIIACSFVSEPNNITDVKKITKNYDYQPKIVAKIENSLGVKNIKKILNSCDGIMVARGDLGVEIPFEKIPAFQKNTLELCCKLGKISIVATEMLESMTNCLRPTRAEVSDCANSVFQLSTATMLSGETAVGLYPTQTVKTMSKILAQAEKDTKYFDILYTKHNQQQNKKNADKTKLVVCITENGDNVVALSSTHIKNDILAITNNLHTFFQLSACWGVTPFVCKEVSNQNFLEIAKDIATKTHLAHKGDTIKIQYFDQQFISVVL